MNKRKNPFPYYVGIESLHTMAHKHTKVCVMNILGKESSTVTPISHSYSGGNIVAGVQFGRSGEKLSTSKGDIPVFGSIKDILDAGIVFDTGVIYLPPAAVNHAVSELCARNDALEKIVILTEKISVRDSMLIRFGCQRRKVDVFGGNCLGIANTWDHVRVGGALGGDNPAESLKKGSVAIYSNSGNFSTTISEYLKTAGFGTTTILSSGKDLYIQFALAEFLYCAENDPRTKAIVVYVEPGGYYEKLALDWIAEGRIALTKPMIVCVTGRWKKNITRACGHAGAMAGSGDDAIAKENWFDQYFGVGCFDADQRLVSPQGVRVKSIQDIPIALTEVMNKIDESADFTPIGDLSLKPWFVNNQSDTYPKALALKRIRAIEPYGKQIEKADREVGAQLLRENMRNRSSASVLNKKTQTAELHGKSILDLVTTPFALTSVFALLKEIPDQTQLPLINFIFNYLTAKGADKIASATRGKQNNCTPNAYLAAEVLLAGQNSFYQEIKTITTTLISLFHDEIGSKLSSNQTLVKQKLKDKELFLSQTVPKEDEQLANQLQKLIGKNGLDNLLTQFVVQYSEQEKTAKKRANPLNLLISAVLLSMAWKPLKIKRITKRTAEEMIVYFSLNGIILGCAPGNPEKNSFWKELKSLQQPALLETDYTETCFRILFSRESKENEQFILNSVLNLTLTNGPGTLSAKGAKESVSAKNNIATAYAGFMTNTGLAHGGNGFEAVAFLIQQFKGFDPYKIKGKKLDTKLKELSSKAAEDYLQIKTKAKSEGNLQYMRLPCLNHPIFKNKPVNIDPREKYIWELNLKKGILNPFHQFYKNLVIDLHEVGATRNVFCVNVDAVIATSSLGLFWDQMKSGAVTKQEMQDLVFIMFMLGRMVGISAEIADHLDRGQDMDCRTPASQTSFAM